MVAASWSSSFHTHSQTSSSRPRRENLRLARGAIVARFDHEWLRPHGRAHSTHILKPQVPDRAERIYDEHYSHLLCRHMGLLHYRSEILVAGGVTFLAIERFDREVINDTVQLIHQEDLAQVMSLDWRDTDVKF